MVINPTVESKKSPTQQIQATWMIIISEFFWISADWLEGMVNNRRDWCSIENTMIHSIEPRILGVIQLKHQSYAFGGRFLKDP